jgi:hypothetical protein
MKKITFQFTGILIALLCTTTLFAAEVPEFTFTPIPAEQKFALTINKLKEKAEIILRDQEGIILMNETADASGAYAKVFNLSNLPEGTYYMSIRTSTRETVQPIKLDKNGVTVVESKRKEIYSPTIKSTPKYVDVSLYNGKIDDVKISILDNNAQLVFEEELNNVLIVEKRYNTDKLQWGNYTMIVETPYDVYSRDFTVR